MLVERDRQPLEVREQALAKFEHHIFAQLADQRDEGAGGDRLGDDGGEERGHDDRKRHQVTVVDQRRDAPVDAEADQPRPGQGGQVRGHDQHERAGHRPLVRPEQIRQQPPGPPPQQRGHTGGQLVRFLGGDAAPGVRRHPAAALSPAASPASPLMSSR